MPIAQVSQDGVDLITITRELESADVKQYTEENALDRNPIIPERLLPKIGIEI